MHRILFSIITKKSRDVDAGGQRLPSLDRGMNQFSPISSKTNGAVLCWKRSPLNKPDKPNVRFSFVKTSGYASTDICQDRSVFASVAVRDPMFLVARERRRPRKRRDHDQDRPPPWLMHRDAANVSKAIAFSYLSGIRQSGDGGSVVSDWLYRSVVSFIRSWLVKVCKLLDFSTETSISSTVDTVIENRNSFIFSNWFLYIVHFYAKKSGG